MRQNQRNANNEIGENDVRQASGLSRRDFLRGAGLLGGLAAMGGLAGCGGSQSDLTSDAGASDDASAAATHTVTDMGGTEVELPVEITQYADGWYAHNEVSIMLNQAQGMVATHCDPQSFPWMYQVAPNMSQATTMFGKDFNYEDLVALEPQVVFDSTDDLRDKLASAGIPLVNCMFKTFGEMRQSVTLTAEVFGGDAPTIAQNYVAELDQVLSDTQARTDGLADDERPSVLHGNSVYTLTLDGTGTIIDNWIEVAGGRNANTESTVGNAQATFSLEQVIGWNPDVIITGKADEVDQILADEAWADISAVKSGQVYVNPKGVFGWDRYGVEELLQIQWAAATLHPEALSDLDMRQKVSDFYATYLDYQLTDDEIERILTAQDPV